MCSSAAECVLNRGESEVQSLALRKKINHTRMFTHMYVCAQEKYLGSTGAQGVKVLAAYTCYVILLPKPT